MGVPATHGATAESWRAKQSRDHSCHCDRHHPSTPTKPWSRGSQILGVALGSLLVPPLVISWWALGCHTGSPREHCSPEHPVKPPTTDHGRHRSMTTKSTLRDKLLALLKSNFSDTVSTGIADRRRVRTERSTVDSSGSVRLNHPSDRACWLRMRDNDTSAAVVI